MTTILIVDDDEDDRYLLQSAFEKVTDSVHIVPKSSGTEALSYLQQTAEDQLPCLIVLDYNMPGLNGKDVLVQLCKMDKLDDVPKVIFSTSNAPFLIEDCLNNGAFAYKVKPLVFDELLKIANELLVYCGAIV